MRYSFLFLSFMFSSFSLKAEIRSHDVLMLTALTAAGFYIWDQGTKNSLTSLYSKISENHTKIQQDPQLILLEGQKSENEQDLLALINHIRKNQPLPLKDFLDQTRISLAEKIKIETKLQADTEAKIKKTSDIKTHETLTKNLPDIRNTILKLTEHQKFIDKNYHGLIFLENSSTTIPQKYKKELYSQEFNRKEQETILNQKYPLQRYQYIEYVKDIHQNITSLKEGLASPQVSVHWEAYRMVKEQILPTLEEITLNISSSPKFKQDIKDQKDDFERAQHREILEREACKQTKAQQILVEIEQLKIDLEWKKYYLEKEKINKIDKENNSLKKAHSLLLSEANRIHNALEQLHKQDKAFKDCIDKPLKNVKSLLEGLKGAGEEGVPNLYTKENAIDHLEKICSDFTRCIPK